LALADATTALHARLAAVLEAIGASFVAGELLRRFVGTALLAELRTGREIGDSRRQREFKTSAFLLVRCS
jgi:hypothetical protein